MVAELPQVSEEVNGRSFLYITVAVLGWNQCYCMEFGAAATS